MNTGLSNKYTPAHATWWRALAGVAGAAVVGAALAFVGAVVSTLFFAGDPSGFGDLVARLGGIILGYMLGSVIGVALVGRFMRHGGSVGGAIAGMLLGVVVTVLLAALGLRNHAAPLWVSFFALVPLLTVAGYHVGVWRLGAARG